MVRRVETPGYHLPNHCQTTGLSKAVCDCNDCLADHRKLDSEALRRMARARELIKRYGMTDDPNPKRK